MDEHLGGRGESLDRSGWKLKMKVTTPQSDDNDNRRELRHALNGRRVSVFFWLINGLFVAGAIVGFVVVMPN